MAQLTEVKLIDDLTGDEAHETVTFGLDGKTYEIDLTEDHAVELRDALAAYVGAARRADARRPRAAVSTGESAAARRERVQAMREGLRALGYPVKDRGRIPADWAEALPTGKRYESDETPSRPLTEPLPT